MPLGLAAIQRQLRQLMVREDLDLGGKGGTCTTVPERVRAELYGHPRLVQEAFQKGGQC